MTSPEDPEKKEADEYFKTLGREFWTGQALRLIGVVLGIWLAARAGFQDAARFSRFDNVRLARRTLEAVKGELEDNLRRVRTARDRIRAGRTASLETETLFLETAATRSSMTAVDPAALAAVERLHDGPLSQVRELLRTTPEISGLPEERDWAIRTLSAVLEEGEREALPRLSAELANLDRLETSLREAP